MNKDIFLYQLAQLLYGIPEEERDEAMDYYRSYFDDAGAENEAAVLEELGSPEQIAASIKEGLNSAGDMSSFLKNPPQVREKQSQYGEEGHGRQDTKQGTAAYQSSQDSTAYGGTHGKPGNDAAYGRIYGKSGNDTGYGGAYQKMDGGTAHSGTSGKSENGTAYSGTYGKSENGTGYGGTYQKASDSTSGTGYGRTYGKASEGASGQASYRRYDQYESRSKGSKGILGGMDKRAKLILLIILAVFALPVWGTVASGILGVAGIIMAAVIVLGMFSLCGVLGGLACTVMAVIKMCTLSLFKGLVILGVGMLLIAGGGISIVLLLLLCGRLLPWAASQVIKLFGRMLAWGRSMA